METLKSQLGNLDLFGIQPTLNIQGKIKTYSLFGLLLTFLVIIFMVWMAIVLGQNFLKRSRPFFITSELQGATVEESFSLTEGSFPIAFGLVDQFTGIYYSDPRIFSVSATLYLSPQVSGLSEWSQQAVGIEICNASYVKEQFDYGYEGDILCLAHNQISEVFIQTEERGFVSIAFNRCDNTTSGGTCASKEVIDETLKRSFWVGFNPMWSINPLDHETPLKRFTKMQTASILLSMKKEFLLQVTKVDFISDDAWLLEDPKTTNVLVSEAPTISLLENQYNGVFFEALIQNSGNKLIYDRKYPKIQDILANISGLASTMLFVLSVVALPYQRAKMREYLINQAYEIKIGKGRRNSMRRRIMNEKTTLTMPSLSTKQDDRRKVRNKQMTNFCV